MDIGVLGGGLCAAQPLLLAQPQRREQGSVQWCGAAPMSQLRGE